MKLPFTTEQLYATPLSFTGITEELENKRSVKYDFELTETEFYIYRYSHGVGGLHECFPTIKGEIVNQDPTRVFLILRPGYRMIIFFLVVATMFAWTSVFGDNWTINGVKRLPTLTERIMFFLAGSGIPSLWCYLQYIRPIKKTKNWIVEKLGFVEQN